MLKKVRFEDIPRGEGACAGGWVAWRMENPGHYYLLWSVLAPSVIYFPSISNGWINFKSTGGNWYVVWSEGDHQPQDRSELNAEQFLNKRPRFDLQRGVTTLGDWRITVSSRTIDFRRSDVRFSLERHSSNWSHNGVAMTLT